MFTIFWICLILILYTYFGYPLFIYILAKIFQKKVHKGDFSPPVSIILTGYNEEKNYPKKLDNLLSLNYPGEIEIIAGSDGSDDETNNILKQYENEKGIKTYISHERNGKVNCLISMVPMASHEYIFMNDVRQKIDKHALKNIMKNFNDPSVGCVSGELLFYKDDPSLVGEGVGFYWKYEKWIRKQESRFHSMIGATGAIYALRKSLYNPPPNDILLDDVYIPLSIISQGYRALFDDTSYAYDKVCDTSKREFRRKVRTIAGNFQFVFQYPEFFNPFKNKIAFQFLSHKILRAFNFVLLISLFISNITIAQSHIIYLIFFFLQLFFYLLSLIGFIREQSGKTNSGTLSIPYVFCVLHAASIIGLVEYLSGKQKVTWKKSTH